MTPFLFVYGTLRSGFENEYARMLRAGSEFVGEAEVTGSLRAVGEYTALVAEGEGVVRGELYRMREPEKLLRVLDDYEGGEYERIEIQVNGGHAWIYRLRR